MISAPERPAIRPSAAPAAAKRRTRLIAVMPAFNEAETIASVIERLYPLVDKLIIVDDGSVDDTRQVVFNSLADKPHAHLVSFNRNRGMSAAYYAAFQQLRKMVEMGQVGADDVVVTVDADGQHDPASLDLVLRPIEEGADACIARRDFRLYPLYKRVGNWVMSAWASLWSGRRYVDVESGYRAFRVGPLLEALEYYKGYKYSETVEIAVILPLLGYKVHDTTLVDIPVFRSRTRLKDVGIDLVAMPCAWWRVMATRSLPKSMPRWAAFYVLPLFFLAAMAVLLTMLTRPIYLANDTINNYAHVWYISHSLFSGGTIPVRFAGLDDGHAFTFPYGVVPWTVNALVYPLLGDWSVTLFLVLAGVTAATAATIVRPSLRDPWLMLLFIANPFFIDAVAGGQYSFLWATAAFFGVVWSVERQRWLMAAVLMWLTASTHPIEGGLAVTAYVAWCAVRRPQYRLPLALASGATFIALTPFMYFAYQTPARGENSWQAIVISILQDLPRRGTVMGAPFALAAIAPFLRRHYLQAGTAFAAIAVPAVLLSSGLAADTALANVTGFDSVANQGSYYGIAHRGSNVYGSYVHSTDFQPNSVYRVLSANDREQGAYYLIRNHAVLSNEFFSESQKRRNWSQSNYRCYLAAKHIDRVVVERAYESQFSTNEPAMLANLASDGMARVTYTGGRRNIVVYDVRPFRDSAPAPASLKACAIA